jgi:hypothetical protein
VGSSAGAPFEVAQRRVTIPTRERAPIVPSAPSRLHQTEEGDEGRAERDQDLDESIPIRREARGVPAPPPMRVEAHLFIPDVSADDDRTAEDRDQTAEEHEPRSLGWRLPEQTDQTTHDQGGRRTDGRAMGEEVEVRDNQSPDERTR